MVRTHNKRTMAGMFAAWLVIAAAIVLGSCDSETPVGEAPVIITVSPLRHGFEGVIYNQVITAEGTAPIRFTSHGLPAWLTLSAEGVISGTPNGTGEFSFDITAYNDYDEYKRSFSVYIKPRHQSIASMQRIQAGSFLMGAPAAEPQSFPNERPRHHVTISSDFYIGRYLVTQRLWTYVMGSNITHPNNQTGIDGLPAYEYPVTNLSWYHAIVFANRLSIKSGLSPAYNMETTTGTWSVDPDDWGEIPAFNSARWNNVQIVEGSRGYRLLTEAQWEFAARAGTTTAFSNGTNNYADTAVDEYGWFVRNSGGTARRVGTRHPNPLGLFDMHGNVQEWLWDRYGSFTNVPQTDPMGADTGDFRAIRGGCFRCFVHRARSAARRGDVGSYRRADNLGIRLARPVDY